MSTTLTESQDPAECTGLIAVRRFAGPASVGMCFQFTTQEGRLVVPATVIRDLIHANKGA